MSEWEIPCVWFCATVSLGYIMLKRASFVSPALVAFVTFGMVGRGVMAGAACVDGNFLAAIGPNTALNAVSRLNSVVRL